MSPRLLINPILTLLLLVGLFWQGFAPWPVKEGLKDSFRTTFSIVQPFFADIGAYIQYMVFKPDTFSRQGAAISGSGSGLVAHYPFDESSGAIASDASGNNNTGTLTNGPTWIAGKVGSGALQFDGVDDYVDLGSVSTSLQAEPFSVSAWFKAEDGNAATIFSASKSSGGWDGPQADYFTFALSTSTQKLSVLAQRGSSPGAATSPSTMQTGRWYHAVAVFESDTLRILYIDGVQVATNTANETASGINNAKIGARAFTNGGVVSIGGFFKGEIDDVRIYNRVLTAADVAEIYTAVASVSPSTPPASQTDSQTSQTQTNTQTTTQQPPTQNPSSPQRIPYTPPAAFPTTPAPQGISCGAPTSNAVAISFDTPASRYNVIENRMQWVALSAWSPEITYTSHLYTDYPNIKWSTRYKAYRQGGAAAIREWAIDESPNHGTLYEGSYVLRDGSKVSDPDALVYVPDNGYIGTDSFTYCVADGSGRSNTAAVELEVVSAGNYSSVKPLGIPDPDFGIEDSAPADPSGWPDSEVPGYYYFDSNDPNCSDANTYGHPSTPRCSLGGSLNALTVPAGGKAVFRPGTYTTRSANYRQQVTLNGTANNPAWLVGVNDSPIQPVIHGNDVHSAPQFHIYGNNFIVDGIHFNRTVIGVAETGDHNVLRHSKITNNPAVSGTTVSLAGGTGTHILAFSNHIGNNGHMESNLSRERDVHGFTTSGRNVWWLENLTYFNAGDSFQLSNHNVSENVYIGHNKCHSDGENCVDIKDFNKFVVSENDAWDYRRVSYGNSGGGAQNIYVNDEGVQQGYGYIINNRAWDTSGTGFGSSNIGGSVYFIGNQAFASPNGVAFTNSLGGAAKQWYFNTAYNVLDGFSLYTPGGSVGRYVVGNIVSNASRYAMYADTALNKIDYNAYENSSVFASGSNRTPNVLTASQFKAKGYDAHSLMNATALFEDARVFNFRLRSGSALIDAIPPSALSTVAPGIGDMQRDLGITLADFTRTARPVASNYDIGAYEYWTGRQPTTPVPLVVTPSVQTPAIAPAIIPTPISTPSSIQTTLPPPTTAPSTSLDTTTSTFVVPSGTRVTTTDTTNVRTGPATHTTLLDVKPKGSLGTTIGTSESDGTHAWYRVAFDNSITGYVRGDLLTLATQSAIPLRTSTSEIMPSVLPQSSTEPALPASSPSLAGTTTLSEVTTTTTLRYGDRSSAVATLQRFLIAEGYLTLPAPTGYFGLQTEASVKAFQRATGITPVGYVGAVTKNKINTTINTKYRSSSASSSSTITPDTTTTESLRLAQIALLEQQIAEITKLVNELVKQLQAEIEKRK